MSYGWYLLHWPAIILIPDAVGRHDRWTLTLSALVGLVLAFAATRYVEQPLRDSARPQRPGRVFAWSLAGTSVLLLAGSLVVNWAAVELRDPYLTTLQEARDGRSATGAATCTWEVLDDGTSVCVSGDPEGEISILLVGDSHAAQWASAIEEVAREEGYRLIVLTRGGCPAIDVQVRRTGFADASRSCNELRAESTAVLRSFRPDVVMTSNADYSDRLQSETGGALDAAEARDAYAIARIEFATRVVNAGARLAVIEDNPVQTSDPIECLAKTRDVGGCSAKRSDVAPAIERTTADERAAFGSVIGYATMPVLPLICDRVSCSVEQDGIVVFADASHLSTAFTASRVGELRRLLDDALSSSG